MDVIKLIQLNGEKFKLNNENIKAWFIFVSLLF